MSDIIEKLGIKKWEWEQTERVENSLDVFIRDIDEKGIAWAYNNKTANLIAAAPEMLERDICFIKAVESLKEKCKDIGDTGAFYVIHEVMKHFSFIPDIKATGKSWEEIKELL
jgi:hypothetical protein